MVKEEIRQKIADAGYENALLYDNQSYDDSIIGVDEDGKVVYDYDRMAVEFNKDNDYEIDDTAGYEWVDFNTIRATPYMGALAPVIISDMSFMGDEYEDGKYTYMNMITTEPYNKEIVFKI